MLPHEIRARVFPNPLVVSSIPDEEKNYYYERLVSEPIEHSEVIKASYHNKKIFTFDFSHDEVRLSSYIWLPVYDSFILDFAYILSKIDQDEYEVSLEYDQDMNLLSPDQVCRKHTRYDLGTVARIYKNRLSIPNAVRKRVLLGYYTDNGSFYKHDLNLLEGYMAFEARLLGYQDSNLYERGKLRDYDFRSSTRGDYNLYIMSQMGREYPKKYRNLLTYLQNFSSYLIYNDGEKYILFSKDVFGDYVGLVLDIVRPSSYVSDTIGVSIEHMVDFYTSSVVNTLNPMYELQKMEQQTNSVDLVRYFYQHRFPTNKAIHHEDMINEIKGLS